MKCKIRKRRGMSLDYLLKGKTKLIQSIDLDPAYIRPRMNYITDKKEELDIYDKNIITEGDDFPINPENGQIVRKNGETYIYRTTGEVTVIGADPKTAKYTEHNDSVGLVFEVSKPIKRLIFSVFANSKGIDFVFSINKEGKKIYDNGIITKTGENICVVETSMEPGRYEIKNLSSWNFPQLIAAHMGGLVFIPYPHKADALSIICSTDKKEPYENYYWFYNWKYVLE